MLFQINPLVDILTISVGIFSIISVIVVSFQYFSAGKNQTKLQSSKRHLFEIILGFTAYTLVVIALHSLPR